MYMASKNIIFLSDYVRVLLREEVLDMKTPGDTALASELNKPINRGFPFGRDEQEQIKLAINNRDKKLVSFELDAQKNQISFERNIGENNFYYVIRKCSDQQDPNSFKYIMWYAPFKNREDIGKPGNVQKKESNKFDKKITTPSLKSLVYNFIFDALLMN
jgi:hypothetical protein